MDGRSGAAGAAEGRRAARTGESAALERHRRRRGRDAGRCAMSEVIPVSVEWLALREQADARSRSEELAQIGAELLRAGPVVVHDLGSGTGSMMRWLRAAAARPADMGAARLERRSPAQGRVGCRSRCDRGGRGGAHECGARRASPQAGRRRRLADHGLGAAGRADPSGDRRDRARLRRGGRADAVQPQRHRSSAPRSSARGRSGARVCLQRPPAPRHGPAAPSRTGCRRHRRRPVPVRRMVGAARRFSVAARRVRRHPPRPMARRAGSAAAVEERPALGDWASGYLRDRFAQVADGGLRVVVEHRDLLAWP